eukprot:6192907-Pleurochrysis_carterae.AAC.2
MAREEKGAKRKGAKETWREKKTVRKKNGAKRKRREKKTARKKTAREENGSKVSDEWRRGRVQGRAQGREGQRKWRER